LVSLRHPPDLATHLPDPSHLTHLTFPTLSLFIVLIACALVFAQSLTISPHADPPPADLADPLEALMAPSGERIVASGTTLEFWWVKSLPLMPSSTAVAWSAVEEGTLIGAVTLSANYPDIRGKTMKAGIYTLRYGVQPQDGDHAGVSPHREFLMISPAALDNAVGALGHDGTIGLAKQTIGGSHPASWSLDPLIASEQTGSTKMNDAGQTSVIFSVPASRDGKDVGALLFGLILVGTEQ
jgi:hypothetical protein